MFSTSIYYFYFFFNFALWKLKDQFLYQNFKVGKK